MADTAERQECKNIELSLILIVATARCAHHIAVQTARCRQRKKETIAISGRIHILKAKTWGSPSVLALLLSLLLSPSGARGRARACDRTARSPAGVEVELCDEGSSEGLFVIPFGKHSQANPSTGSQSQQRQRALLGFQA
jgi:hypothetical protein